jgi:CubicO group peptidase (beta-lactamase class C family)
MIVTDWQARHGLTAAAFQDEFDQLASRGYRLIKVSGYDIEGEPRYAGVWYMQQGNRWQARHGISEADYQAAIEALGREGYRPVDISVFRSQERTLFCAIWEEEAGLPWIAKHRLTPTQYQNLFDELSASGYRLRCMSPYEDQEGERYACIWDRYNGPAWEARHGLTAEEYQQEFDIQLRRGYRLVRVVGYSLNGATRYAAIWEQSPGHPWQARHGVPHGSYQQEFDAHAAAGRHLVDLSGYRAAGSAEYTTIWEQAPERDFASEPANSLIVPFMQKWAVPGLSLAIARNGSLRGTRCFGYANRITREVVTEDCRFRLASLSKPITSAAVHLLIEQGQLALSDRVFGTGSVLGAVYGMKPYSTWLRSIAVQHLLEHSAGGWVNDSNDPMFQQPTLSQSALITWTLDNQPLTAAPGTQYGYSNFGYCLLGRIIEQVSGQSYRDFVQQNVLIPCGAGQMSLAGRSASERLLPEAMYFGAQLAAPYELPIERMDAHGGWIGTPSDVIRFLMRVDGFPQPSDLLQPATVAVITTPSAVNPGSPTMPGYAQGWAVNTAGTVWHDGTLPGTQAIVVRVADQREWCAVCNMGRPNTQLGLELDNLMWQVQALV